MADKKTALVVSVDSATSRISNVKVTYGEENQRVLRGVTSVRS